MYRNHIKRVLDLFTGIAVLGLLWPVMALMAIAIFLEDPGPVLFRQRRLGLGGREFTMLKFRTMKQNTEHTGSGVYSGKDDPRVLKTGRFFRAASLDELIQAVHLISGKMSLIGPRPPLTYHPWPIEAYTEAQKHMFDVRPGITGWAQVNGRKGVEWHKRIELSCWYAEHVSFALDVKILLLTIFQVLRGKDNVNTEPTLRRQDK